MRSQQKLDSVVGGGGAKGWLKKQNDEYDLLKQNKKTVYSLQISQEILSWYIYKHRLWQQHRRHDYFFS